MYKNLQDVIKTIEILRSPNGCQWDREQTHSTLRPNMIEEAYEAVDAINAVLPGFRILVRARVIFCAKKK